MKIWTTTLAALVLTACASMGGRPEFTATRVGSVEDGTECVAEEVLEEGWAVTAGTDAGVVRAESGVNWIEAHVLADEALNPAYVIEVTTSDTEPARELARDVVTSCGG